MLLPWETNLTVREATEARSLGSTGVILLKFAGSLSTMTSIKNKE